MILRLAPLIFTVCIGCRSAEETARMMALARENKDVVVLSNMIRSHMLTTNDSGFTLADIAKLDTLGRIANNFSAIEVSEWRNLWRGGYAVYFKFADRRNKDSIELRPYERFPWKVKIKKDIGWNDAQRKENFGGEIHLHYQERFYYVVEIIVKESR